jgi:hypothetical protein
MPYPHAWDRQKRDRKKQIAGAHDRCKACSGPKQAKRAGHVRPATEMRRVARLLHVPAAMPKWFALETSMTNERWGWILVALAAVLIGVLTRAPAVAAKAHEQVRPLVHVAPPTR